MRWRPTAARFWLRTPTFSKYWFSGSTMDPNSWVYNPQNPDLEPETLKVKVNHVTGLYNTQRLRLHDAESGSLMEEVNFQNGIARIDLNEVQWTEENQATYIEFRFPNDAPYHPGELTLCGNLGATHAHNIVT